MNDRQPLSQEPYNDVKREIIDIMSGVNLIKLLGAYLGA